MKQKKNLLFVCVENANRSQMAQAFANILGGEQVNSYSAGSRPSGIVNPKAITAMKELDYDLSVHSSTGLGDLPEIEFDAVVTMGCGDSCPNIPAKHRADWQIPDPREMPEEEFRAVRDLIRSKVGQLLSQL